MTDSPYDRLHISESKKGYTVAIVTTGHNERFLKIDKHKLGVDYSYQRNIQRERFVQKVLSDFNPASFGALIVSDRVMEDGKYPIIDGQGRLEVALRIPTIETVSCLMYTFDTVEAEAIAYNHLNRDRIKQQPYDIYHAGVLSGEYPYPQIDRLITSIGREASAVNSIDTINNVTNLISWYRLHTRVVEECLPIVGRMLEGEKFNSDIMDGLFMIGLTAGTDDFDNQTVRSFRTYTAARVIENIRREVKNLKQTVDSRERVAGAAVLKAITYKRKDNIVVTEWGRSGREHKTISYLRPGKRRR